MESNHRQSVIWSSAAFVAAILFVLVGLQSFGIWDPWELGTADNARKLLSGESVTLTTPPFAVELVRFGFQIFGTHEWAGRLPIAIFGVMALIATWFLVRRYADVRTASYAVIVSATSPLFLLNARQMLGNAPGVAGQAVFALGLAGLVFPRENDSNKTKGGFAALAAVGLALSVLSSGVMQGPLPVAFAVCVAAALRGFSWNGDRKNAIAILGVLGGIAVMAAGIALAVMEDSPEYNAWIGGASQGSTPPAFERAIERVFHAFAPWSALIPLAWGRLFVSHDENEGETSLGGPLRHMVLLWAALGYAAQTFFESRYGHTTFVPVLALSIAVAIFLREIEDGGRSWWSAAIVAFFFAGLILRDFALYPVGPIEALGIGEVTLPEVFNPKLEWGVLLGLFAVTSALVLGIANAPIAFNWKAPLAFLQDRWRRGFGFKAWMALGVLGLAGVVVFGLACILAGDKLGLPTLTLRVGKYLLLLPFAIPLAFYGAYGTIFLASRLGRFRVAPILVVGVLIGGFTSFRFLPSLSNHLSPREVYDTYNAHAGSNEPLAEYRVGGRAAAYYARGDIREMQNEAELVRFLSEPGRKWTVFPSEDLASIDHAFRQRTRRHLFVVNAHSARITLAATEAVQGLRNENPLSPYILDASELASRRIEHRVGARFEDKVELVGYDLRLPHNGYVGAGEAFTVTWYFRVLKPIGGSYKMFLHVDGMGNRLNGDHDPVKDMYPLRLWAAGDLIVDEQELRVPATYRPGNYTMYFGFFAGETRLRVEEGPRDNVNRANAGTLVVR